MRQFCKLGTNSGREKMNRWYLTLKYVLTMWQVSFFLLYPVAVVSCFRTDMLLHSVKKCLIQKVSHKTTLSFSSNLRNPWQKLIWKHTLGVQQTAKMADLDGKCLMHFNRWIEHGKGLCKNGSKSAISWTKRTSRRNLFWTFAAHTEWTRFVEVRNYLWWDLDIYVWPRNKMTVNALEVTKLSPPPPKKKVTWVIQSSRPCCLFSLISRPLWWQSGFPVARLSVNTVILKSWLNCVNMWEGNGQDCGEMGEFCCRTMCHPVTLCL